MSDKKKKLEENLKGLFSATRKSEPQQPESDVSSPAVEPIMQENKPEAPAGTPAPAAPSPAKKEPAVPVTAQPARPPEQKPAATQPEAAEKKSTALTPKVEQPSAMAIKEGSAVEERKLLIFKLCEESYAIDVANVRTTIKPQTVYILPGTAAHLKGLINLRGEVVPVFDLRARFSLPEKTVDPSTRFIVVELGDVLASLVVDSVVGVESIPADRFEKPSGVVMSQENRFLKHVIRYKDQLILNLNLPIVVSREENLEEEETE